MKTFIRQRAHLLVLLAGALSAGPAMALTVNANQASFQYGLGQANIGTTNNRHVDNNALDGDTSTFRSLGTGGAAVFGFGTAFTGDVTIWEATFNSCGGSGTTCSGWPESVKVYAGNTWDFGNPNFSDLTSSLASNWTLLGDLGNKQAQGGGTLTANSVFNYLLVIDQGLTTSSPIDGFDVAEIKVSAVPIPAAGWLFGSALLGLAAAAKRRRSGAVRA